MINMYWMQQKGLTTRQQEGSDLITQTIQIVAAISVVTAIPIMNPFVIKSLMTRLQTVEKYYPWLFKNCFIEEFGQYAT